MTELLQRVSPVPGVDARYVFEVRCTHCPNAPLCTQLALARSTSVDAGVLVECPDCERRYMIRLFMTAGEDRRMTPAWRAGLERARAAKRQRLAELHADACTGWALEETLG